MAEKRKAARTNAEALDRKLDALLADRSASPSARGGELAGLLRVASDLRDLPRAAFRAGLAREFRAPIAAIDLDAQKRTLAPLEERFLGRMDRATVMVFKFSGRSPWERHPDGDELISVLEGEGEITVLTDEGPVVSALRPGHVFLCPKGLWHRTHARTPMTALYVTPLGGGEFSFDEDPQRRIP
jgi:quercetin dioxygenase-like cupin family protein